MSGILRSFDRLISQSQLAKSGHKYLLRSSNTTLHPSSYYYAGRNATTTGRLGNDLDIFQLGITSAALTRQANSYAQLLSHVDQETVRSEIQERISKNVNDINAYFGEIISLFRIGKNEYPIQTVADIAYVLAFGPVNVANANQIVANNLLPTLAEKLTFASAQNIQDILTALVKLNYLQDKQLINRLLTELAKKDFPSQLQYVSNHAWTVNQYESKECSSSCNYIACGQNHFERYIAEGGADSNLAKIKFTIQEYADQIMFNYINPLFFREKRVNHRFESRNAEEDTSVFQATLAKLAEVVPEASETIATIKARL